MVTESNCSKELFEALKLFNFFLKMRKEKDVRELKIFINALYGLNEEMPIDFYELLLQQICDKHWLSFLRIIIKSDVYSLISYLKHNQENVIELEEFLTPLQYYTIPKRYINKIVEMLKQLESYNYDSYLYKSIKDESIWLLKRNPCFSEYEYIVLSYKIYLSIGLDNGLELLSGKYGIVDYEKIYYLFSKLNTKDMIDKSKQQVFNDFLFNNKKDSNNVVRLMLSGQFKELFLNFDYFYNKFDYFIVKLGSKMSKNRVKTLLEERYLTSDVSIPEITGDILEDMVSSYYCKYDVLDVSEDDIKRKNFEIYNKFLRGKYKSSIPQFEIENKENYICEIINLDDPRNLVLGYRAGNCFRINGDASVLFYNFLRSEHMRLVSISTLEYKDFAMMLVMRNGNVLIGQGIETSKWVPMEVKGSKLYDACREVLREMMNYMNSMGDEIVATIIGSSNSNVSQYNNQILPFLVNPILESSNNYYNGIYNYQCLLDLSEGKSLNDIKLYVPTVRYMDKRENILRRDYNEYSNYMDIQKRLISLRFMRCQKDNNYEFYEKMINKNEIYVACNVDWYIMVFDDGSIDGFILDAADNRARDEYDIELEKIQEYILNNIRNNNFGLRKKLNYKL